MLSPPHDSSFCALPAMTEPCALILFGHGSRDPLWAAPIEAVAARLRDLRPELPVRCAYLELMQPDLPAAARQLVADGARRIDILPMFLGRGRHAREDLPLLLQQLQRNHPDTEFQLRTALGEHPAMLEAIARWALNPEDNGK
jgi:sirohydrochlorin cobaltochelatase